MGNWHTLHVFDDRRFYAATVPMLRGDRPGLEEHFQRFLKTCMVSERDQRLDVFVPVFRQFSPDFTHHPAYASAGSKGKVGLDARLDYYLRRFFEFVVFSDCASFFPYFKLGKTLFLGAVDLEQGNAVARGLLSDIAYGKRGNPWAWDGDGIQGWWSAREAKALNDSGSIMPKDDDFARQYVEQFRRFLGIVTENRLGLLSSVNLDSYRFKSCAPPLPSDELWKGVELSNLVQLE